MRSDLRYNNGSAARCREKCSGRRDNDGVAAVREDAGDGPAVHSVAHPEFLRGRVVCNTRFDAYRICRVGEPDNHYALDKTIGDLLSVPSFKELVEAIGFVPEKAAVADARAVMANIKNCNDVFVTANGKRDEPAVRWFTNTLLAGVQRERLLRRD